MEPLERYSLRTLMKFYTNLGASININILNEEVILSLNFLGFKRWFLLSQLFTTCYFLPFRSGRLRDCNIRRYICCAYSMRTPVTLSGPWKKSGQESSCILERGERHEISLFGGINSKSPDINTSSFLILISIVISNNDTMQVMNLAEENSPWLPSLF